MEEQLVTTYLQRKCHFFTTRNRFLPVAVASSCYARRHVCTVVMDSKLSRRLSPLYARCMHGGVR